MRRDDAIRIRHMIEAAEAAQRFLSGRQRDDLDADEALRFAPSKTLAKRLPR